MSRKKSKKIRNKIRNCVTQGNMSLLMAKVKCPHERGPDLNESGAITEVSGDEFGGGRQDQADGGSRKDRTVCLNKEALSGGATKIFVLLFPCPLPY
jgi:hypothetical protein